MTGIDVSAAQGLIDWPRVRTAGVEFALLCASCGHRGAVREDARFAENCAGAAEAGIAAGAYHALGAADLGEALAEAEAFLSVIAPYRARLPLWACCAAEEAALPRERGRASDVIAGFLGKVRASGFASMLFAEPQTLARLGGRLPYPLWLCSWNVPEARAVGYSPAVWQYDAGRVDGMEVRVSLNRGYFRLRDDSEERRGYHERILDETEREAVLAQAVGGDRYGSDFRNRVGLQR